MRAGQTPLPLGVLISGGGTNLQAIIDAIADGQLPAEIRLVVSNRSDAYGLSRAERHGIPSAVLPHGGYPSRQAFEAALTSALRERGVELVVLAGFMRLLSPFFIRTFPQRIMNIHPGLLPAPFPGLHAQRQALGRGVRIAGATVHFVDEEMDHGPIICQAAVPVYPDDTEGQPERAHSGPGTPALSACASAVCRRPPGSSGALRPWSMTKRAYRTGCWRSLS